MIQTDELKLHKRAVLVMVLAPLCLTFIKYFGDVRFFAGFLESSGLSGAKNSLLNWARSGDSELKKLSYWIIVLDTFYLLVPIICIKLVARESLESFGFKLKLENGWWKVYLVFMAIMLPLVIIFSGTESFQMRYPFYDFPKNMPLWPKFWFWELLYFSQFFCLEFFFRGFMVHGMKKAMGIWSVFVMTIPYCMIHFGKPMPETLSAIVAGIVLGYLSLRSGSIMLGFLCHISVAVSMDMMALWREGYF